MKHIFEEYGFIIITCVVVIAISTFAMVLIPIVRDSLDFTDMRDKITDMYQHTEEYYINANVDDYNNKGSCKAGRKPDWKELKAKATSYYELPAQSKDFIPAVAGASINASVWNYPEKFQGGAIHLGIDYGANLGSEIVALANSIVIISESGHSTGELGNLDGGTTGGLCGGGNQVYLMSEVKGKVYAFMIFHMKDVSVSYGDVIAQGTAIGTVGSSGNSTGPHAHIEMYCLGEGTISDALSKNYNSMFNIGRGSTALNYKCSEEHYTEDGACILDPSLYLG